MEYVLVIVTVLGLVIVLVIQSILHYKERIFTIKINKAKDLSEVETMFSTPVEEDDEEDDLVELSDINLDEIK